MWVMYMRNTIRVAAIQHKSQLGKHSENISHVTPLIEDVAHEGAQIVALPEMSLSGYTLNKEMWDYSEPINGPTEKWLQETARKHRIFLCGGLTQHEGYDYYNTYLVTSPDGETIGRVRKTQTEFCIHRAGPLESHIINTELGRIGVGICADAHMTFFTRYMKENNVDVLLLPHAVPTPYKISRLIKESDIKEQEEKVRNYAKFYADTLGVSTVFVDQTGSIEGKKWPGIIGRFMDLNYFRYPGYTAIATPEKLVAQLEQQEGYIVADLNLDDKELGRSIQDYGGVVHPGSALFRFIVYRIDAPLSKLRYNLNENERRKMVTAHW
jgi:N-carbamoylputrescine amidase